MASVRSPRPGCHEGEPGPGQRSHRPRTRRAARSSSPSPAAIGRAGSPGASFLSTSMGTARRGRPSWPTAGRRRPSGACRRSRWPRAARRRSGPSSSCSRPRDLSTTRPWPASRRAGTCASPFTTSRPGSGSTSAPRTRSRDLVPRCGSGRRRPGDASSPRSSEASITRMERG